MMTKYMTTTYFRLTIIFIDSGFTEFILHSKRFIFCISTNDINTITMHRQVWCRMQMDDPIIESFENAKTNEDLIQNIGCYSIGFIRLALSSRWVGQSTETGRVTCKLSTCQHTKSRPMLILYYSTSYSCGTGLRLAGQPIVQISQYKSLAYMEQT